MLNNFTLIVALRYFKAKKNEKLVSFISGFSLLGVMLGVAALIIVMAVMNGFRIELTKNIIGLNSDILILPLEGKIILKPEEVIEKIRKKDFIDKALPTIYGQALAVSTMNSTGIMVKGFNLEDLPSKPQIYKNIIAGEWHNLNSFNQIALGSELALILGVKIGDIVKFISPQTIGTILGSMPRSKDFVVGAIFNSGMYDYDSATAIISMESAQRFFSIRKNYNAIEVYTKDPNLSNKYAGNLYHILGNDYYIQSWLMKNEQLLNALKIERTAMFTILSLIILVAAFNIISSLFMLVKDKTKDIAILRTIGASKTEIMLIFMLNGFASGVIGTMLGVTLGCGFAANIDLIRKALEKLIGIRIFDSAIYYLYNLPSKLLLSDVLFVSGISLILSLTATIYPAYRAAKLNPIEAIRYE